MTAPHEPLWPITLVRLTSLEAAQPWVNALTRFAPFALPWIVERNNVPLTSQQWVENVLSWMPNVWLGVDDRSPLFAAIWLVGGLDDVIPHESASIHGMAHPVLNVRVHTRANQNHTAKSWMAKALLSATFDEYACHTLTATIPNTHAGARGFCLNYGFQRQPSSSNHYQTTYALTAARYYTQSTTRRIPHVLR
ncbi:MAG: hypothetical protein QE263_02510 [Vampirovibrionales bacterium]|nr:hypothetical protein [Vampirovibrionales bacterium]